MALDFNHGYAQVDAHYIRADTKKLIPLIESLRLDDDPRYRFFNLPADEATLQFIMQVADQKKSLKPSAIVVIGIGGSNLGTLAIAQALAPIEKSPTIPQLFFADTLDSDNLSRLIIQLNTIWANGGEVLLNVISKSGTTLETIANFNLILSLLQKMRPQTYRQWVVVTSDDNSPLYHLARQQGYDYLPIPAAVGGRFSVFSCVGLFPLAMIGIAIKDLCAGAQRINKHAVQTIDPLANWPIIYASALDQLYQRGFIVHDHLIFSTDLTGIGFWYRQLLAESLGKTINREKKGILPTVSLATTDLHSVLQLYLAGPSITSTTFLSVKKEISAVAIPNTTNDENSFFSQKTCPAIMQAIMHAVQSEYQEHKKPFFSIQLSQKNAESIGELLQFYMISVVYLGYLWGVNPFDQPEVENYKKKTKEILRNE